MKRTDEQADNRTRDGRGRFRRGASGNPKGRPRKGEAAADYLSAELSRQEWARQVARLARAGSLVALRLYADYVFGPPLSTAEAELEQRLARLEEREGA